jgi:hypothetical protein
MNTVVGGWQVTLINTMTSGLPVNINYSLSSSSGLYVSDLVTYRPSQVAGATIKNSSSSLVKTATALNGYFNVNAVAAPTANGWGNITRNAQRSSAFYQADLGLHKAFPLWSDSSNIDFRAEAFNVLNKVNYQQPNGTWATGSTSFGQITGAYPARQLQLAAKFIF